MISQDLSHNCLARATILADLLKDDFEVEIIGPCFGKGVWKPARENFNCRSVQGNNFPRFFRSSFKLLKQLDGDIIYAVAPKLASFGNALLKKAYSFKPLILDIGDWEVGFYNNTKIPLKLGQLRDPNSLLYTKLMEKLVFLSNEITVSSTFLNKKFGGKIIHQARDENIYDPSLYDKEKIKKELGLSDKKVIMFSGTPRVHKGLDLIIKALKRINDKKISFVIVGYDSVDSDTNKMIKSISFSKTFPLQPLKKVPYFLSAADLIVLPQMRSKATIGQVPTKVFDAMAMNIPIIASNVSDLPQILNGCGTLFEAGDYLDLAKKIKFALNNPKDADRLAKKARKKFLSNYSYKVVRKDLLELLKKYQ